MIDWTAFKIPLLENIKWQSKIIDNPAIAAINANEWHILIKNDTCASNNQLMSFEMDCR